MRTRPAASALRRVYLVGVLVQPFDVEVTTGGYWLAWLQTWPRSPAIALFRDWVATEAAAETDRIDGTDAR